MDDSIYFSLSLQSKVSRYFSIFLIVDKKYFQITILEKEKAEIKVDATS